MGIKKRLGLIVACFLASGIAQACPSQQAPEQRLQQALAEKKDLALVEVESETWQEQPGSAFAILKVTRGWGSPKKLHLTYTREATPCNPLQELSKGERYLVVLDRYKVVDIFEYAVARKPLKSLGDPHYRFNRKGKLIKSSD